jgi:hypothetical protein
MEVIEALDDTLDMLDPREGDCRIANAGPAWPGGRVCH